MGTFSLMLTAAKLVSWMLVTDFGSNTAHCMHAWLGAAARLPASLPALLAQGSVHACCALSTSLPTQRDPPAHSQVAQCLRESELCGRRTTLTWHNAPYLAVSWCPARCPWCAVLQLRRHQDFWERAHHAVSPSLLLRFCFASAPHHTLTPSGDCRVCQGTGNGVVSRSRHRGCYQDQGNINKCCEQQCCAACY